MLVRSSDIPFTIYRPGIVVGRRSDGRIRRPLAFYRILEFLAKMKKHQCSKHGVKAADWLDLHLRLEAYPSDKVYFVPIDYVQKVITDLFFCKVENQTYHITGDSPVKTTDISEVTSPILKVTGVTVEEKVENPSMDEKLVQRFLGDLLPYFSSQTVFDQSNIIAKLGKEVLDWKLDLNILIGEFYKDNYPELH
jgi:nucleoside-diphosphate-sugar epimerase